MEETLLVVSVLVITANAGIIGMVIFIKELRTFTNYLVVSLAVSDMLTGVNLLPLACGYPIVARLLSFATVSSGVLSLCTMTWDRYVAVTDPFGYKEKLQRYYKKLIIAIWITAIMVPLTQLITWYFDHTKAYSKWLLVLSLLMFIFVPYVFIVAAYVRIWLRLRSHAAEMKRINMTNEQRDGARRASLEGKTVKLFVVVVSLFLVSWFPLIYVNTVGNVLGRPDLVHPYVPMTTWYSAAGSSLINPILYGFMKRDFVALLHRRRNPRVNLYAKTFKNKSPEKSLRWKK